MSNNEQILNNLIGNSGNQSQQSPNAVPTGTDDEVLITTARVVSIRYKVYVVLVAILVFVLFQSFLMPLYENIKSKSRELDNLEIQIEEMQKKEDEYRLNRALVDQISELDPIITSCVNEWEWCKEVPEILQENDNFSVARSYMLLGDMEDEKMEINEKKIVENIDSFLLAYYGDLDNKDPESMLSKYHNNEEWNVNSEESKDTEEWSVDEENEDWKDNEEWKVSNVEWKNIEEWSVDEENGEWKIDGDEWDDEEEWDSDEEWDEDESSQKVIWEKNGSINKIIIWDKQRFNDTLYYVPIELSITFDDKDWLLSFINNVEKRVPEKHDLRLLYKISKIMYDVVNYDKTQEATIYMYLYYYEK